MQTRTISLGKTWQAYHLDFSSDADDAPPAKIEDGYRHKSICRQYKVKEKFNFLKPLPAILINSKNKKMGYISLQLFCKSVT
ncbi:hypothetical protein [Herbaspirillum sp. meg3]|uniref:hypothetical protein n=1 Tax=Herbaspirillum sp. meg3 TaxID=2025949 RepID=UPI0012FD20E8|nr:hypothetical protein [Herbaspirillum sp. meg3]